MSAPTAAWKQHDEAVAKAAAAGRTRTNARHRLDQAVAGGADPTRARAAFERADAAYQKADAEYRAAYAAAWAGEA